MKSKLFLIVVIISKFASSQTSIFLDSGYSKSVDYYDKVHHKIKKEYFYDKEGKLHPKVLKYDKKGILRECYFYDHGKYLMVYEYVKKGENAGEKVVKINGLKIDLTKSKYEYEIDSSDIQLFDCNKMDNQGLRQGKWYIHDIIKDASGFSYEDMYYTGIYENGMKQGKWYYYYYHGKQLNAIIEYKNDVINGEVIFFDKKGNKTGTYQYLGGIKNGIYNAFYSNGNIHVKATFKNDNFIGEYTEYKKNGKIKKYIPDTLKEHPYR